jgi:hypothetical protein
VVGYVWRPWGIHIDIVRNRGSKGMDGCPLTASNISLHLMLYPLAMYSDTLTAPPASNMF